MKLHEGWYEKVMSKIKQKTHINSPDGLNASFWITFFNEKMDGMKMIFRRLVENIVYWQQIPSEILKDSASFLSKNKKSKDDFYP